MDETNEVRVELATDELNKVFEELQGLSDAFGRQMAGAFKTAAAGGRSLEDVLRRIALNLSGMALDAGLKPLRDIGGGVLDGIVGALKGALPFARGGVPGRVQPFADGGVVGSPTLFAMPGGVGLMGEAGAEAILPLARGPDGRLGVSGAASAQPVNIVFNVTTPDAASFRKSEAQIAGMVARAAARGARSL